MKGVLAKMHGHKNAPYHAVVFNFFQALECTSRVAFDFTSGNLIRPSLRKMQQTDILHSSTVMKKLLLTESKTPWYQQQIALLVS